MTALGSIPIAALGAVAFLPWLLFAIPSGAIVDRLDRRLCMLWANAFRATLVGGVALLIGLGHVDRGLLYAATFLLGTTETIYDGAVLATVTSLRAAFIVAGVGQVLVAFWMWHLLHNHRAQLDTVGRFDPIAAAAERMAPDGSKILQH